VYATFERDSSVHAKSHDVSSATLFGLSFVYTGLDKWMDVDATLASINTTFDQVLGPVKQCPAK
jgi:hypothetical protein